MQLELHLSNSHIKFPLILLQHRFPESMFLQSYVVIVTGLFTITGFLVTILLRDLKWTNDSTESTCCSCPSSLWGPMRIQTFTDLTELKVDLPGMDKTGTFLLHDSTRRNVPEHRMSVSGICFKLMNFLGFLHSWLKRKRNNIGKWYEKLLLTGNFF